MVRPSSRGGVPVFSRPSGKPRRIRVSDSFTAGASPTRPAGIFCSPQWIRPAEEGAGGQDHGPASDPLAPVGDDGGDPAVAVDLDVVDPGGQDLEVRLLGQQGLDRLAIELAVGLGAGAADGRALGKIEHPELDAAAVDRPGHDAVEGVDLPHQMALGEAADGGIAGHFADLGRIVGHQQGPGAEARSRSGRFGPRVTAADHHDIVSPCSACHFVQMFHVKHRLLADAEFLEDEVQDLFHVHPARDPPDRPHRQPQILGLQLQLARHPGPVQRRLRLLDRRPVARPGQNLGRRAIAPLARTAISATSASSPSPVLQDNFSAARPSTATGSGSRKRSALFTTQMA